MTLSIAYLCDHSPLDRNLYSGGNARMFDALRRHAGEVTILSNSWHAAQPVRRMIEKMPDRINLRLRWRAHLALAPIIAKGLRAELERGRFDVLFCAYSIWSLSGLRVPQGVVTAFSSDTTQSVFQSSEVGAQHGAGFRPSRPLDAWVKARENRVLQDADLVFWPSAWQRDAAQRLYDLPQAKTHRVPWGANLDWVEASAPHSLSPDRPVELLLLGRDWWAKGGPLAFETMQTLRSRGIDARLTVIGCVPPPHHVNAHVTVHGNLDKAVPAELAQLETVLRQAHFLVQPSYESYGFAFCEASAYGLPSLCLRAGGVPVLDGVNGHALPIGSGASDFADVMQRYTTDAGAYHALSLSARQKYETRLNWDAWGRQVAALLQDAVALKQGG